MAKYYNWYHTPAPIFKHGDKVFLDSSDIHTTHPSTKLSHCHLEPYIVKKWVRPISYYLKLSLVLQRLHPVFHIIKLIIVSKDPILERYSKPSLNPIIINREEE